ncbi:MAG: class I SAM-dependent methyltransferase [Candidatus Omnitrophica bacterium]|nr:class I SAM-dependent methyltransferase [Candidatus Omnitrophota bacterium]
MEQKELQEKYYSTDKEHSYLRYRAEDAYAKNLCKYLRDFTDISKDDEILEIGAGAGRFTIHLLREGFNVTCVDISEAQLWRLRKDAKKAGLAEDRLKTYCMSIEDIAARVEGRYDVIVGFFILHHLDTDNIKLYFSKFRKLFKDKKKICFLEPNRLNVLFILQTFFQKDMDFHLEKGLLKLSRRFLKKSLESACYAAPRFKNFGFFPPQIINRFPSVLKFERMLERVPILNKFLPFLLIASESIPGKEL